MLEIEDKNIVYVEESNGELWRMFKLISEIPFRLWYFNKSARAFWQESNNYSSCVTRIATKEEEHWMNEMIKADKFIPYEEAMKTFQKQENKNFAILLNNQEELDACIKWAENNGYKEYSVKNTFKDYSPCYFIANANKNWVCLDRPVNNPIKTLSELSITIENKPQFEVGKWYTHPKWSPNSYIKFHSIRDYNSVFELERISQGSYKGKNTNWSISYEHTLEKADMRLVSNFLPEKHPDKQLSIPEYVECVNSWHSVWTTGKIYKTETIQRDFPKTLSLKCNNSEIVHVIDWDVTKGNNTGFKLSNKEAYEAQFKNYPLTTEQCISNNDIIEVGDEVEIIRDGCGNCSFNSIGYRFIVEEIAIQSETYLREFKGKPTGVDISYCKLIKKASQTTTKYEKKVAEQPKNVPQTTTLLRFEPEDELLIDTSVRQIKSIKQELIELN